MGPPTRRTQAVPQVAVVSGDALVAVVFTYPVIVSALPGLAQFRTPYRFQIPAAIGLAVLVGIVASVWFERLRKRPAQILLAGLTALAMADLVTYSFVSGFRACGVRADKRSGLLRDRSDPFLCECRSEFRGPRNRARLECRTTIVGGDACH